MTNGEKFKEVFGISHVDEGELYAFAWLSNHNAAEFSIDWWNAEYNEPVIRDNGVKDELNRVKNELEPTTKNDLGVDAVSRQAVIDLMMQKWGENFSGDDAMQESIDAIRVLPSVTPQEPRKGHWVDREVYDADRWKCSECGRTEQWKENFCPNCGADMRGEE